MKASLALKIACLLLLLNPGAWAQNLGVTNLVEGAAAGSDCVALVAAAPWTATSGSAWLHLSPANQSGTGSTNVVFAFDANAGPTRTGMLTIAGQTLAVTQAGATYVAANTPTVLGGLAVPRGVAVDSSGNVFIADTYYQVIWEWKARQNFLDSLAWRADAPSGVAVDGAGNVFIVDDYGSAIKEWKAANNTVTTLVSASSDYSGLAVDGAGNLYFADSHANTIMEWHAASNTVTTLISSGLNDPEGLAVDGAGNIYIADYGDNAIKKWTGASHTLSTLVSSGLNGPFGVAVDGGGNLYISEPIDQQRLFSTVKKWSVASNSLSLLLTWEAYALRGVGVDGAGNLFFAAQDRTLGELPRAFVDPTAKAEPATAGSDALPVVVPGTADLDGPFAPASDSDWLTITGIDNGVVSFAFSDNPLATSRTANITLLGQAIPVTQSPAPVIPPTLSGLAILSNGAVQFGFTNHQGAQFTVLTATNLLLPLSNWTALGTLTGDESGQYQFTDLTATNGGQRFYRVSSP